MAMDGWIRSQHATSWQLGGVQWLMREEFDRHPQLEFRVAMGPSTVWAIEYRPLGGRAGATIARMTPSSTCATSGGLTGPWPLRACNAGS